MMFELNWRDLHWIFAMWWDNNKNSEGKQSHFRDIFHSFSACKHFCPLSMCSEKPPNWGGGHFQCCQEISNYPHPSSSLISALHQFSSFMAPKGTFSVHLVQVRLLQAVLSIQLACILQKYNNNNNNKCCTFSSLDTVIYLISETLIT